MQAFLQRELGGGFVVESAGTNRESAGQPANPYSLKCLELRGMDLPGHASRWIGELGLGEYAHIVCVGEQEKAAVLALLDDHSVPVIIANEENGGIPNPYQKGWNAYQTCARVLGQVMPKVAQIIRQAA